MLRSLFRKKKKPPASVQNKATPQIDKLQLTFTKNLNDNLEKIKQTLQDSSDITVKKIVLNNLDAAIIFIDTLSDKMDIQKVIDNLTASSYPFEETVSFTLKTYENKDSLSKDCINDMLAGYVLLFFDGQNAPYSFMARKHDGRSVSQPINEQIIQGSHEGFTESLETNLFLTRKNLMSPNMAVKTFQVGKEAQKTVALLYLNNLADPDLIQKVEKRINSIDTDSLFSFAYLVDYIEDYTFTPFPQFLATERVDRVCGNLTEGRIALFVEGSSSAIILPVTFFAFYQSPDDYNTRFTIGSFYRLIRYLAFVMAILLPSLYIAIIGFHNEVLPSYLVFMAKKSVETIPYRPLIEAGIVEIFIELIREASLRLPTKVGPTIGIVGGLVIGDAIVQAGLVSNLMVVIVALTSISSFVIPSSDMSLTVRILRFPFMIMAAFLGLYGILIGFLILIGHLCKLQPFGIPYLAPLSPIKWSDLKDTIIRAPIITMDRRPVETKTKNIVRQGFSRWWKKNE